MSVRRIIKVLLTVLAIAIVIRVFFVDVFVVKGDSMSPAIKDGDYVAINRLAYKWGEPERGDIIVALPRDSMRKIIKRVVGLPGERIVFEGDKILVKENRGDSGKVLKELYLTGDTTKNNQETFFEIVDPSEYYVLGDNRDASIDSRRLGMIDTWNIKGKVIYILHF